MLTIEQRAELDAVMRRRHGNAALARRARCVVLWSDGERRVDIRSKLACNDEFVSKWTRAFEAQGLAGLSREIHVICDNVSSHKTPLVQAFLAKHCRVHMHCTPTYSSWLNQVENWFARIQRDVITRGVFTSIKDLDKKLMHCVRQYNKDPKPLKWTFADPTRHITSDSSDSVDWSPSYPY